MQTNFPAEILQRLRTTGVVAGFAVERMEHAVPIARALVAGGIDAIELTLRTLAGFDAIRAIADEVPEMLLGVGTILTPEQVAESKAAGAEFGVSPGLNRRVVTEAATMGLPFAPGVATPTELEAAIDLECRFVKYFPAETLGGVGYLRSMAAPYRHLGIQYFPLGGVNSENLGAYLNEPNVPAVGGSWIVNSKLVAEEDWDGIAARAAEACSIASRYVQKRKEIAVDVA